MNISNKRGSALIIALVVLTLLTMMSTVFFEKIHRFSQRSEGIENSNVAYYKALWVIEEMLYTGGVNKYSPWSIRNTTYGSNTITWASLIASTWWTSIPVAGKWNSPYDSNYNIISIGEPVQIVIPEGLWNWWSIDFKFRIPQISTTSSTGVAVIGTSSGYILWTLASSGASLFASGETNIFRGTDLDNTTQVITTKFGTTNTGSTPDFWTFYNAPPYLWAGGNGSDCTGFKCTLKLSLIRPVPTGDAGRSMTFLEYKISGFPTNLPSQYMDIHAEGYAYGFLRSRDIKFPQITTNTALDFAVLQ